MVRSFNKVLFVEDNPIDARLIERTLARDGSVQLHHVDSLQAALHELRSNEFDAVLLDLMLPDSPGGVDTLKALHDVNGEIAVIVLTGMEDTDLALLAVRQGAQDYLVKEQCNREGILRSIRYSVERVRHVADEQALREARNQLNAAVKIQKAHFPAAAPVLPGYDIAGCSVPAAMAGGDYYDFLAFAEYEGIAIGDASGHGLGPAMVMSDIRAVLRTLATFHSEVGEVLRLLNMIAVRDLGVSAFMTILLVRLDVQRGQLQYAGAGHSGLLLNERGEVRTRLSCGAPPLNVIPELDGTSGAAELQRGEVLLMFTDGVTDARSEGGELFGEPRLLDFVRSNFAQSAHELSRLLIRGASEFSAPTPPEDDMTVVVVKRLAT